MKIEDLQETLKYPFVTEHIHTGRSKFLWLRADYEYREIRIESNDGNSDISLLFESLEADAALIHLAFGPWHAHFDSHEEESENLEEAIEMAKRLFERKIVLAVERDMAGRYKSGTIRDSIPGGDSLENEIIIFQPRPA